MIKLKIKFVFVLKRIHYNNGWLQCKLFNLNQRPNRAVDHIVL